MLHPMVRWPASTFPVGSGPANVAVTSHPWQSLSVGLWLGQAITMFAYADAHDQERAT